jgi:hypothetical protein
MATFCSQHDTVFYIHVADLLIPHSSVSSVINSCLYGDILFIVRYHFFSTRCRSIDPYSSWLYMSVYLMTLPATESPLQTIVFLHLILRPVRFLLDAIFDQLLQLFCVCVHPPVVISSNMLSDESSSLISIFIFLSNRIYKTKGLKVVTCTVFVLLLPLALHIHDSLLHCKSEKYGAISNYVSDYINLLVRIAHIICNHPLFHIRI